VDEQPVLVDQAEPDEGRGKRRPADLEVAAGLALERGDLLGDDLPDQRAVPLDLVERFRADF
jgi:hypothetical protein